LSQELVFLIGLTFLNFWISIVSLSFEISLLIDMWWIGLAQTRKKENMKKQARKGFRPPTVYLSPGDGNFFEIN
jgi:hypothetical protein